MDGRRVGPEHAHMFVGHRIVLVLTLSLCGWGCSDDQTGGGAAGASGSGGAAGIGGTGGEIGGGGSSGIGGSGGTVPSTAFVRIVHLNTGVATVDVADGGQTTVIEPSLMSGEVTRVFEREAGPRTFDFLGPGEGDLRFSTEAQNFEAGKEYVLVLLPDPADMEPNANQTVSVEIERSQVSPNEAGIVLVHGSDISVFENADIRIREIDGGQIGPPDTLETGVGIGTQTAIQSLSPGEYGFSLFFDPPEPELEPAFLTGRRELAAGEFVVAIGGEAIINTTDADGWWALSVDDVTSRDMLELLVSVQ